MSIQTEFPRVILHNLSTADGRSSFHQNLLNAPETLGLRPWESRKQEDVLREAQEAGILVNPARSQLLDLVEVRYPGKYAQNSPRLEKLIERLSQFDTGVIAERSYRRDRRFVHVLPQREFVEVLTSRNRPVISVETQQIIEGYTIAIAGLTVGGGAADLLVAAGFMNFILADMDNLTLSNLDRYPIADIGLIDTSKARLLAMSMYDRDPYIGIRAYEKFVGPVTDSQHISRQEFMQGATHLVEAITPLDEKVELHQHAQSIGIPSLMATDLGLAAAMVVNNPDRLLFGGRLTDEEIAYITSAQTLPPQEFLQFAIKMIGPANIPRDFANKLGQTSWLPQPGAAARLSAVLTNVVLFMMAEDKPVLPDFSVDIRAAASQ